MKKVLLISNRVMHYRVSIYNHFARAFREMGYEFIVRSNELQRENPYPIEFDFKEIPFKFSDYRKEINDIRPDYVIVFLHLKNFIVWPLVHWLKLKNIPVVYWNKGINLEVPNPYIRNRFFYYVHSICDGIILYSKEEIKHIKKKNRHKVFVANNTVNFEDFPDISDEKEQIKSELGIPFKKVVLFVGRMWHRKKVLHLVEIFHSLNRKDIGLVLVGDDMGTNISEKINRENTIYLGEIYDPRNVKISRIFKMADVFCIPGDVGLGLNQAFFWGLPVVTEDGFQPPEVHYLVDGRNGFIVSAGDLEALREKMLYLLDNDDARREFSANARKDIMEKASINRMFAGFSDCIKYLERTN